MSMKRISRDTDYAVRAFIYMAQNPRKTVSVSELTENVNIPRAFLRRILQVLCKHKLLRSQKGKGGGFLLAKSVEKISLIELMRIFQGEVRLIECLFKRKVCPDKKVCPLRRKVQKIEQDTLKQLELITIGSLLREG